MIRRFVLLVVMAGAVLLVCSVVALAAVRTGTGGDDRLTGTGDNDRITGRGGDDTTVGKAGNDTYYYANGWGQDTVIDSTGSDTLSFSAVTGASRSPYARYWVAWAHRRRALRKTKLPSIPGSRR